MISSAIIPQPLARLPWRLIFMIVGIAGIGFLTQYSAAGGSVRPWAMKQGITVLFFLSVAVGMSTIRENTIKQLAFPVFAAILIMLIIVEAVGFVGKGAQRWIDLGFIRLQPSEFMKPAIVIVLARFYELLPPSDIRKWRAIWPAVALIGVPWALILIQPDLGTATMVLLGGVAVMFIAGVPLRVFLIPAGVLGAAIPIVYQFMHGYQRKRIDIFLNPESDPLGAGYHITQSKIAIGSGGIFGKGFLHGSQSHLDYLPEGHTDFAFATWVEEWGLVGGALLIFCFAVVIMWGLRVASNAEIAFRPADRGRPHGDDLLLFLDQPDDGDGPGTGRRHPSAARQLRRIGRDDRDDLPRNPDVAGASAADDFAAALARVELRRLHTRFQHATGRAAQGVH